MAAVSANLIHETLMDAKDSGMFLVAITVVTLIALVGKFAYFVFSYFYFVKGLIFNVIASLANQAYSRSTPSDALSTEIEKDFDTYIVNLVRYIETNMDSNRRLDVLNDEAAGYVAFHNSWNVARFMLLAVLVSAFLAMLLYLRYNIILAHLQLVSGKK